MIDAESTAHSDGSGAFWHAPGRAAEAALSAAADYVSALEQCFVELRGRGVQWTPADAARARSWYIAGLPLGAVLRVLQARARAYRFLHGASADMPVRLAYFEPALIDHCRSVQRFSAAETGVAPPPKLQLSHDESEGKSEKTSLCTLIEALPPLIAETECPVLSHVYRKAFELLDKNLQGDGAEGSDSDIDISHAAPVDLQVVVVADDALDRCKGSMLRLLKSAMPAEHHAKIENDVDNKLAPLRGQLSKRAITSRKQAMVQQAIATHFNCKMPTHAGWQLPQFS